MTIDKADDVLFSQLSWRNSWSYDPKKTIILKSDSVNLRFRSFIVIVTLISTPWSDASWSAFQKGNGRTTLPAIKFLSITILLTEILISADITVKSKVVCQAALDHNK